MSQELTVLQNQRQDNYGQVIARPSISKAAGLFAYLAVARPCHHLPVTLVLSVNSRDSVWVVTDRRLSFGRRRPPIDDAMKVMNLHTTDGVGLLAYAGLGATPRGTQPSEWMGSVLRGRRGLNFEKALGILADAATRELPRYLTRMPGGEHFILVSALIQNVGPRVYRIDNVVDPRTKQQQYSFMNCQMSRPGSPSVRIAVAGTGGLYLAQKRARWARALLALVNAHDRDKVSDLLIADRLAGLNYEAHQGVRDGSVGPRCIVVWRRRPDLRRPALVGGHQAYDGVERERNMPGIPTIGRGMDVGAIVGLMRADMVSRMVEYGWMAAAGMYASDADIADLNARLAKLPSEPDEKLR